MSAALVAVATMVFSVYVAATKGYFNVGETMVYTTALLFGPYIGVFAGGFGSMIADLLLGYPHYALGTLVIKGCEGLIVGYLAKVGLKIVGKGAWKALTLLLAIAVAVLVSAVGIALYSGLVEVTIGLPVIGYGSYIIFVPTYFWLAISALAFLSVTVIGARLDPVSGIRLLAMFIGGLQMILGYFLYQYYVLGFGPAAFVEIPVNVGQMLVGIIVAFPLVRSVERVLRSRAIR